MPAIFLLLFFLAFPAAAQTDGLLQLNDELHRFLLRQQGLGRLPEAHLVHRPLSAYEARRYLDSLAARSYSAADPGPPRSASASFSKSSRQDVVVPVRIRELDRRRLEIFRGNEPAPGTVAVRRHLPFAYRNGRDLLSVEGPDYGFQANPLLYVAGGRGYISGGSDVTSWQNTRGLRLAGHVGRHLFFEARLEEVQRRDVFPSEAIRFRTAPRLAFVRINSDSTVYDYQIGTGVVGVRTKHFEVRFGRDRNEWGPGEGSLFLSNFAPLYDFLQLRTTLWRLQYVNLFAALTDLHAGTPLPPNHIHPRKYGAFHELSLNISARAQLYVFESVIFGTDVETGREGGFDLAYLNPVILYRTIEADRGSPDNVLLGLGGSWILWPALQLYGQFLIDEYVGPNFGSSRWENKWGGLVGLYAVDLVPDLSIRLEYARLRPYLYTHRSATTAFVHYQDLLGHPAGPNAEEIAVFADYSPTLRLLASASLSYTRRGRDAAGTVVGADPLMEISIEPGTQAPFLAGIRQRRYLLEFLAGYQLLPDLHVSLGLRLENLEDAMLRDQSYVEPFVLLRWGLPIGWRRY